MKSINELNNKYNNLIVIGEAPSTNGRKNWLCECQVCHEKYEFSGTALRKGQCQCSKCQYNGKTYGSFTVIGYSHTAPDRHTYLKCQCACGNIEILRTDFIKNKKYVGCRECRKRIQYIDEVGNVYGKLTVLSYAGTQNKQASWLCQCECGNFTTVLGTKLRFGSTTSCGCTASLGEEKIAKILSENNISFKTQVRFPDCVNQQQLRYDFGIYSNDQLLYLIEYDGIQHYKVSGWNDLKKLQQIQKRDQIKNEYCLKNNIPLIRIPYTKFKTLALQDLILESSDYVWEKQQNINSTVLIAVNEE